LKIIVILLLIISVLFAQESNKEKQYQLGEGTQVADLPLYFGGYFSLNYRNKNSENKYRLNDIALLAYGDYRKISYMAELEFKKFYSLYERDGNYTSQSDTSLHIERLYIDYNFDENYMLRLGKFNSQTGFWNLLPINVLRATTSNPVSTNILFPTFTTGVYASYSSYEEGEFKIDAMLQHNEDLDSTYNNYTMDEHYAIGTSYIEDTLEFKLNIGMFDSYRSNHLTQKLYYTLIALKYEEEAYQIMGELGSQSSKEKVTTMYAGYLQGLYRFTEKHAGVLRFESYDDRVTQKKDNFAIFGYTYRPSYPIALKAEYQLHTLNQDNQFLFSLSVLF